MDSPSISEPLDSNEILLSERIAWKTGLENAAYVDLIGDRNHEIDSVLSGKLFFREN